MEESPGSPQPFESEEPQMSADQEKAMAVLEKDGTTSPDDHNPEMSAFALESLNNSSFDPDSDIDNRISKANEALAKEPQPEEREKRIKFKENLIDFEAPPAEEEVEPTPRSPESETKSAEEEKGRDEKDADSGNNVLVEKEGKFELVDGNDVHGKKEEESNGSQSIEDMLGLSDTPSQGEQEGGGADEKKSRPGSAPSNKQRNNLPAPSYFNPPPRPKSAGHDKLSRGHRSAEMIEEAKEQARQRKRAEEERKQREKEEREAKERENREVFEAWCKEKEKEAAEQRRRQRELIRKQQELREHKESDRDPFKEWLQVKSEQEKRERLLMKCQKEEDAQWVAIRTQKDCDKAYRRWLKQKRRQELEEKSYLLTSRASSAVMVRKSRKSAQMAQAIKLAQQFKFIDHYGYRF